MSDIPTITLNDGNEIPQLGFGVFKVRPDEAAAVTTTALEVGYRHIDTAEMYGNEAGVGQAIANFDRADVYVTSKLNNQFHRPDDARDAFDSTLAALGTDYVDLFLIHWPLPTQYGGDYVSTWQALEQFKREGRARSVGVSNFQISHLERLRTEAELTPAVNQVELHPYLTQEPLRAYCAEHGIAVEAWSPIAKGAVADDLTIRAIGERVGRSAAQVTLRWHIQRGDIVFPKSTRPERMRENLDLFSFELSEDDMAAISALNRDERTGPDPDVFDWIPN